jgi:hypothetical protein
MVAERITETHMTRTGIERQATWRAVHWMLGWRSSSGWLVSTATMITGAGRLRPGRRAGQGVVARPPPARELGDT